LCACFFGQSAVISSSQSISLALRPCLAVGIQHVELADQISEDDCTVAGHSD
jgi:hypothetical protein